MNKNYRNLFEKIANRYGGVDLEGLEKVLCPILIPIHSLDKTIVKLPKQSHYRATFTVKIQDEWQELMQIGRTGKFIPEGHLKGDVWREIAKGRILEIKNNGETAEGEIYTGGSKGKLIEALEILTVNDYLEIDQYGAAPKVLSGLVEYSLSRIAVASGYNVRRMPEDMAKHLGRYYNYDFEFERYGVVKKVEVKSLWGTNTDFARLIHSTGKDYPTSSCKYATQDIFAVSLFLRTGNIRDFAFARSVPSYEKPYGLPPASGYPEHVNQNPRCEIGDGVWFGTIDEVWHLD